MSKKKQSIAYKKTSSELQKILDICRERIVNYPEECRERQKIELQIKDLENKINLP